MVLVTGSWRIALAGLAASLIIFAVVFFAVIKPDQNTANQALKQGLQQSQQALNQAQKQVGSISGQANGTAQKTLDKAAKLTACVSAAGTDVAKVQACQVQFAK